MKKLLTLFAIALAVMVSSCSKFDDTAIWDKLNEQEETLNDHEKRIAALEELCRQINTNIDALQTIVEALEKNDYVTNVSPVREDGEIVGYTISFANSDTITIYNGKDGVDGTDGKDGYTPQIGVMKDTDGIYYWTIDGEWLLDGKGNKIKAVGEDGLDGQDGTNGVNGIDGITPRLKIENDYWYVSYDEGATWIELDRATGEDGADGSDGTDGSDGDSIFSSVTQDEEYVYFNLTDGTMITLPKLDKENVQFISYIPKYSDGKADVDYNTKTVQLDFQIFPHSAIADLTNDWESTLTVKTSYVATRTITYLNTPIIAYNADEENATITVTVSLENLNDDFFNGIIEASMALQIYSNNNIITSEYVGVYDRDIYEIRYTTSDGSIMSPTLTGNVMISNTYHDGIGIVRYSEPICTLPNKACESESKLVSIQLPHTISSIGENAFSNCRSLASVIIGNNITSIGAKAFYECSSLNSIIIPDSVISIGNYAFSGCSNLESMTIGKHVASIGSDAFSSCTGELIIYCNIPNGTSTFGKFKGSSFSKVTIGDGVTSIGDYAFENCDSLTNVTIPDSTTIIGSNSFYDCDNLTSVIVGNGITLIGEEAFYYCSSLSSITIPASVISIGAYAFCGCSGLTSITIPNGVTVIGNGAFSGCSSLTSVIIPDSVISIGDYAFNCKNVTDVTLGKGVELIGNHAFDSSKLKNIYCNVSIPPAIYYCKGYNSPYGSFPWNSGMKIYVPTEAYATYTQFTTYEDAKTSQVNWSKYKSYLAPYNFEE